MLLLVVALVCVATTTVSAAAAGKQPNGACLYMPCCVRRTFPILPAYMRGHIKLKLTIR